MDNEKPEIQEDQQEHKILFKNSFFSFLGTYGSYVLLLVTSFLKARLISIEAWGILIIALSYIGIIAIILSFLPPGLSEALKFYISKYKAQNETKKVKSVIKYGLIIKLIFAIPLFLVSIFILGAFINFFNIPLENNIFLLYLLSPLIIQKGIGSVLIPISQAFNKFKSLFILDILNKIINIVGLVFIFLFVEINALEIIAIVTVVAFYIPFIFKCILVYIIYLKLKPKGNGIKFRKFLKKTNKYGSYMSGIQFLSTFWDQIEIQSIGIFSEPIWVTGYNISNNYTMVSRRFIGSLNEPLMISYSRLGAKNQRDKISKIFIILVNFTQFIVFSITGILVLFSDFFFFFLF